MTESEMTRFCTSGFKQTRAALRKPRKPTFNWYHYYSLRYRRYRREANRAR